MAEAVQVKKGTGTRDSELTQRNPLERPNAKQEQLTENKKAATEWPGKQSSGETGIRAKSSRDEGRFQRQRNTDPKRHAESRI